MSQQPYERRERRPPAPAASVPPSASSSSSPASPSCGRAFDSWSGLGLMTTGMQRAGWDLQLTAYGDGHWRATFFVTGVAHSIVGGSAWEGTPWRAVQRAG